MNNYLFSAAKLRDGKTVAGAALCALIVCFASVAGAASWEIDPVRVALSPQQQTAAIKIKNNSNQATTIQINVLAWSQRKGQDVYSPSTALLVSPPIFTIAPNSEQIIRTALRQPADELNELAYRINLQELPAQPEPGFTGLQVALRIGLPVFIQPQTGRAAPKMLWRIAQMPGNILKVELHNQGTAHVQVADFALYLPGKKRAIVQESGSSYVLAGQTHEWQVKLAAAKKISAAHLRLKAHTDAGSIDTELELDKP